ncbi:uncharacterized protein [Paramisgurnus dabryanus]|uniref:uncharacterized protein n=1 Tax=Paramisgurnus dabryanus TaxID=90735 RepID=UPI0031F4405C
MTPKTPCRILNKVKKNPRVTAKGLKTSLERAHSSVPESTIRKSMTEKLNRWNLLKHKFAGSSLKCMDRYKQMEKKATGYFRINLAKNWTDAQSYCRQHYTDLAIVHNSEEENQVYAAVVDSWPQLWIGLYKEFWQWSDQWNFTFRNWAAGHPFISSGDCAAMSTTDSGKWVRYSCDQQYPFICYGEDKLVKRQTVRLSLSNDGNHNMNDPSVQTAILNEISEKLKIMGLNGLKSISWKKDEVGKVFHLTGRQTNLDDVCKYIRN